MEIWTSHVTNRIMTKVFLFSYMPNIGTWLVKSDAQD
jgi:hypothetical protein